MGRQDARRVAVVGAGASGVTAAKCLREAGLVPVVFEATARLGGVWTFDEAAPGGGSPAYRSLHTNTPKHLTAFSDFPFPARLPAFPPAAAVVRYLDAYAARFAVRRDIPFETRVEAVVPLAGGRWRVDVRAPDGRQSATFDAVVVCSGMFDEPAFPDIPGLAAFSGTLLHSKAFADATPFAGQRVLVVGTGSSGIDIAVETGALARQTLLSGRHNAWAQAVTAPPPRPGAGWGDRLARHVRLRLGQVWPGLGPQGRGPDAPFVMERDRLLLDARLREAIAAGAVRPRPGITRVEGRTIAFADGRTDPVDVIVCATGYRLRIPFLAESIFRADPRGLGLYRVVVHPDRPTLAFLGMTRTTGAIMPLAEMQARWTAAVLRGRLRLPPPVRRHAAIAARRRAVAARAGNPFRVELEPYLDLLAAEVGVLPQLWRHPRLWRDLLLGPPIAARYRLDGPHRARTAARILRAGNRAFRADAAEARG